MSRTDWIELAAKDNWPAARVRNVISAIKSLQVKKWGIYHMAPLNANAPPKRMTREDGIFWLSQQVRGVSLIEFKLTRPVDFLTKYLIHSKLEDNADRANKEAIEIVHGTIGSRQYASADKDCASDWMLGLARKQYLVEHRCSCYGLGRKCYCAHAGEALVARADLAAAPAPPPAPAAPAPAVVCSCLRCAPISAAAADDVSTYVEGYDAPAPAAAAEDGGDYLQRIWDEQVRRAREKNDEARAQSSAPTWIVVPEVDLGIRMPAPPPPAAPVTPPPQQSAEREQTVAPGAPAPESRSAPRFTPEERAHIDDEHDAPRRGDDADDHLFEPPLPTIAEVAERLASLRLRVDAHVAEVEAAHAADQQRKFEDRAALNRLSDRLVSSEMELGLIDDALDHMYAGQQSPANVVGRLAKIISRITEMGL